MEFQREKRQWWERESSGWGGVLGASTDAQEGGGTLRGPQRAPWREQRHYSRYFPVIFPLFPLPALSRTHRGATGTPPTVASGFRCKAEVGVAMAAGREGRGLPPQGVREVVPPRAAMLGGAGAPSDLMAFF